MYRALAFHDDTDEGSRQSQIFSLDSFKDSKIETLEGHKTSKRTLLVCSLFLIATTGLLATWVFVARPHFYPKLEVIRRSLNYKNTSHNNERTHVSRHKRSIETKGYILQASLRGIEENHKHGFRVEIIDNVKSFPVNDSRLPLDLIPTEYYLSLNIDLKSDNFTGSTKIILNCTKNTNKILFHGRRIELGNASITRDEVNLKYKTISYLKKFEMFLIEMNDSLEEGKTYELHLDYSVGYGKSLAGLYKSNYISRGKTRVIVSTHFEPIDARSAFPCLDEPFFKAKFHISITHEKGLTALSNMPIKNSTKISGNLVEDKFDTSVRMSTYLVAFSVNDFKYKETNTTSGIKVRVYAREDDYNRIDYAVNAAARIISFYEEFFQIKYPLPKLDLLAVPDFMAGAMEDWGIVSFRSAYLIFDEEIMTVESMRQITLVIAHELAHQWFGNLVTMKWWNDIWLNEGFANFVEMFGTNQVNPQFNALDMQVPTGWQAAISMDSLKNSHPVSQSVKRNSEIDELFDAISYNKGASLLRMVQGFMGNNFIKGVKTYLDEYKFANAETDDLWKHLSKISDGKLNIKEIMDTWTKQNSFPIITLSRTSSKVKGSTFRITQESFIEAKVRHDGRSNSTSKRTTGALWQIPFTYISDESLEQKTVWLKTKEAIIDLDNTALWIKANINSRGFYIVNYDNQTWRGLQRQLENNHKIFSDVNRAGMLHDVFKLACEELLDPIIALNFIKYLSMERDFIPWAMVRSRSECISMMLHDKSLKIKYKKYIWGLQSHLVSPSMLDIVEKPVRKNLTIFERLQRMEAMSFALKHHLSKELKQKVEAIFERMVQGKTLVGLTSENRALALMYGYNSTDDKHWNFLWQIYTTSEVDTDRKIVMKAFAQFKEKNKLIQMLNKSLDKNTMRVQDTIPFLANIVKLGSRKQVWDFVVENYENFKGRYGGGYQLGQLMNEVAGGFNTWAQLKEVKTFFKTHPIGAKGSRTEKQILEKIQANIRRHSDNEEVHKYSKKIKEWLEQEIK